MKERQSDSQNTKHLNQAQHAHDSQNTKKKAANRSGDGSKLRQGPDEHPPQTSGERNDHQANLAHRMKRRWYKEDISTHHLLEETRR